MPVHVRRFKIGRWSFSIRKSYRKFMLPVFDKWNAGAIVLAGWHITFMQRHYHGNG